MLIGLTGYAQSGKDTLANILVEEYGYKRVAFADKIRELLFEMDPPVPMPEGKIVGLQNLVEIYGWDVAKQNSTVRSMLQNLGVGARTVFGTDFWVQEAIRPVKDSKNIVVTDVRFNNEADWIKSFEGSAIWRVKRNGVQAVNSHVSETQMDGYPVDQIFTNNGSIEDLRILLKTRMCALQ